MSWTQHQIRAAHIAAHRAQWSPEQRRVVLRHLGATGAQPSSKEKSLTQHAFEAYMAIAEASAAEHGAQVKPPQGAECWSDKARAGASALHRQIRAMCDEATRIMPSVFATGFAAGYCVRMTQGDDPSLCACVPARSIDELDVGQAHRVIEGLRVWITREFGRIGQEPRTFRGTNLARVGTGHRSAWARPRSGQGSGTGDRASGIKPSSRGAA